MNKLILNTSIQNFIEKNIDTDIMSVLLKKQLFEGVSQKELARQIEVKKKCKKKLPTWFKTPKIFYPKKLNFEQTSSEKTASYKSRIVSGKTLLDLTVGFGVDSYFFSKIFAAVSCCEINAELAKITRHNFEILEVSNINVIPSDGISFLQHTKKRFDCIYLDPSRRDDSKGKVFRLSDCSPNVLVLLNAIFNKTDTVLIKTSPLLDIRLGLNELMHVSEIHIVAVKNEVKELVWLLKKDFHGSASIKTINIKKKSAERFDFGLEEESVSTSDFSLPLKYLYEPNSAILKSGAFKLVGKRFSLKKLHGHSHLYTSNELIDFPGRSFHIQNILSYGKRLRQNLDLATANITVRNFPHSVATIRRRFKFKDGGEYYLFFTKDFNNHLIVLKCLKKE